MLQHAIKAIEEHLQIKDSKTPPSEAMQYLTFKTVPWVVFFTNRQGLGESINSVYMRYRKEAEKLGLPDVAYQNAADVLRRVQAEIELLKKREG